MARYSKSKERENLVNLFISGPRYLIKNTCPITVSGSQTWQDVLENNVGLRRTEGIFVCTTRYCASKPVQGQGWRSEITDTVASFIAKFDRKFNRYVVRVCNSFDVLVREKCEQTKRKNHRLKNTSKLSKPRTTKKRQKTASKARASRMTASQSSLNDSTECSNLTGPPSFSDSSAEEIIIDDNGQNGSHLCRYTGQTFEDVDKKYPHGKSDREFFRRKKTKRVGEPDVRAAAIKEFLKFDKSMLLKMEEEKNKLQKYNLWEKHVLNCPVICTIVQTITDAMEKCRIHKYTNQTRRMRNDFRSSPNLGDDESVSWTSSVVSSSLSLD